MISGILAEICIIKQVKAGENLRLLESVIARKRLFVKQKMRDAKKWSCNRKAVNQIAAKKLLAACCQLFVDFR
jgi:hypothetical protein